MKHLNFLRLCAAALLCVAGLAMNACGDDDESQGGGLQLAGDGTKEQRFAADQLNGSLSFETAAPWSASIVETTGRSEQMAAPDWISLDRYSGEAGRQTLTITLTPNDTGADRSADIVISSGGEELRVSVTQAASNGGGDDEEDIVPDTGEWDWVDYETTYVMDSGEDYHLPGDQYIWFEEPGFFRGGWSDGETSELIDMGEMSWKEFSIMEKPEYPDNNADWTEELIPCVKGHGYFAGWRSTGYSTRIVRFWVEDYIMQGDEVVGAKLRVTRDEFPNLFFAREDGKYYQVGAMASGVIQFKAPHSVIGKWTGNSTSTTHNTYIMDAGPMEYDDWYSIMQDEQEDDETSRVPEFNETDWLYDTEVPCVKGHGYYIRRIGFDRNTGELSDVGRAYGFYVRDYIVENGAIVGLIIQSVYELSDVS